MAALSITSGAASTLAADSHLLTREEHTLKEMGLKREAFRAPRRSHTVYDYQVPDSPQSYGTASVVYAIRGRRDKELEQAAEGMPSPVAEAFPTEGSHPAKPQPDSDRVSMTSTSSNNSSKASASPPKQEQPRLRRPALPPPRRSYSVMDYEPAPRTHRLSEKMVLTDLPGELHFAIFDFLDPIDGTCLGLTNKHFYNIHRRMHGTVPLSVRRSGPNDMEWAWHLAGTVRSVPSSPTTESAPPLNHGTGTGTSTTTTAAEDKEKEKKALALLRVRGQAYCRKCGISRCELHKHIQSWMPASYEYCGVRQKFGPKAPEGAKSFCYLSNPKKPGRCGRHRVAKTTLPAAAAAPSASGST